MRKQCTNSVCRKFFVLPLPGGVCPHCGKAYPRLPASNAPVYAAFMTMNGIRIPLSDILADWPKNHRQHSEVALKLTLIKAVRSQVEKRFGAPLNLPNCKALAERILETGTLPAQVRLEETALRSGEPRMKIAHAEGSVLFPIPKWAQETAARENAHR